MRIISWPRQAGKTSELLRLMSEDVENSTCVVADVTRADMMYRFAKQTYPDIPWRRTQFIPFSDRGLRGIQTANKKIYVDQLDDIFARLFGGSLNFTATMTNGWLEQLDEKVEL